MSTGGVQHVVDLVVDGTKRLTTNAPPTDAYLKWDSPGVEVIKPDEAEKTAKIKAVMSKMQKRNFDKHRHCFRATHVKTQAIVKGKLQVHSDLPDHLNQGLFQRGASYDLIARYANEPYLLQDDKEPGPRGLGIKIFNVPGPHLEDVDPSIKTQDLLFNNAPMLELTDIDTTLDIMSLREKYFDNPSALGLALRTRTDQMKQLAPYSLPNKHIIGMEMYTQSAFRFGDYYGHIALFPISQTQKTSGEESIDSSSPSSILSEKLSTYFASNSASYEIKIQLGTSTILHPTEDASVVWDESSSPYQV